MKHLKFKVHSPEHSEAIQKRLFELGYRWISAGKEVFHVKETMIYDLCALSDGYLYYNHTNRKGIWKKSKLDDLYKKSFLKRNTLFYKSLSK